MYTLSSCRCRLWLWKVQNILYKKWQRSNIILETWSSSQACYRTVVPTDTNHIDMGMWSWQQRNGALSLWFSRFVRTQDDPKHKHQTRYLEDLLQHTTWYFSNLLGLDHETNGKSEKLPQQKVGGGKSSIEYEKF